MSVNLLEILKEHLSSDVVSNLASLLGESAENTTSAVSNALPALLAGLAEKSSDENALSGLFNLIINDNHDGGVLSNLGALSHGGDETTSLIADGGKLLSTLFGEKVGGISNLIAELSGISGKSSESLLGFVTPVVLGLIGKTLKLQQIDTASGLSGLLGSQSDFIKNLIPAGLSGVLGGVLGAGAAPAAAVVDESPLDKAMSLGGDSGEASVTGGITEALEIIEDKIEVAAEDTFNLAKESVASLAENVSKIGDNIVDESQDFAKSAATAFNETAEESGSKLLPWFLIAAALALLWGVLKSCSTGEQATETPATQTSTPAEQTPAPVANTPTPATPAGQEAATATPAEPPKAEAAPPSAETSTYAKDLPTGFHIQADKDGVEQKLLTFIESNEPISKDLWFNMAGIQFDTDKATIRPESDNQITNIAEILKAFPKVKIKIGGYTDNTGKAANNRKLSGNRALAVKKAIVKKGIAANRVSSDGFGSEHPVASNDTPEGRQQNRRIDVRVTEK
jgi:OmpA-OmpF porin, OOP family